uniref:Uncharacterized protein n=1 Tax=Meleagris gallopavo TaxID=9103 RepID=A0A803XSH0_MELGA
MAQDYNHLFKLLITGCCILQIIHSQAATLPQSELVLKSRQFRSVKRN